MTRSKNLKVFLIEQYYKTLGTKLIWDDQKILQLCDSTRMELEELRALLRMTEAGFKNMMAKGPSKQVSLLLYQIAVNKGFYAPHPTRKPQ
jgi:hypothetical protein